MKFKSMKEKLEIFDSLMLNDHAMLSINTSIEGLIIPKHLYIEPSCTLKLSYNFNGPISADNEKIIAELKFGSNRHICEIPWNAVWGILSSELDEHYIWVKDTPAEVKEQIAAAHFTNIGATVLSSSLPEKQKIKKPSKKSFAKIDGGSSDKSKGNKKRKNKLTLVK